MSVTTMIELAWTLVALAGIAVQGWLLRDALQTKRAAKRLRRAGQPVNGPRLRMIRSHVREAIGYLLVHVSFVYTGLRALVTSNENTPLTPGRLLLIAMLMGASVALVVLGLQARQDRLWVRAYEKDDLLGPPWPQLETEEGPVQQYVPALSAAKKFGLWFAITFLGLFLPSLVEALADLSSAFDLSALGALVGSLVWAAFIATCRVGLAYLPLLAQDANIGKPGAQPMVVGPTELAPATSYVVEPTAANAPSAPAHPRGPLDPRA